jgi:hypothetical protein
MSTKSREVIWGGQIMGAGIRAQGAREAARKADREADREKAEAWTVQMEGYCDARSPFQPSANASVTDTADVTSSGIAAGPQRACCSSRSGVLAIRRSETGAGVEMPVMPQEPARSPVHMVKHTKRQGITHYKWVHPDEDV